MLKGRGRAVRRHPSTVRASANVTLNLKVLKSTVMGSRRVDARRRRPRQRRAHHRDRDTRRQAAPITTTTTTTTITTTAGARGRRSPQIRG